MPSAAFERLRTFLLAQMQMSHIYQPVMLRTLLSQGGVASRRDIAAAFLAEDRSQLEYYERVTAAMPARVLRSHGLVVAEGTTYRLAPDVGDLSDSERAELVRLCEEKLTAYKEKRGRTIWEHRAPGLGRIPGGLRYNTLKRAGFRCELCGISAEERALDVDHITPRKVGGTDVEENLQALCWLCNANKGAGDATDFRQVRGQQSARAAGCVFCDPAPDRHVAENTVALALLDRFPVTEGHTLLVPKRHVADYFDLTASERRGIDRLIEQRRAEVLRTDPTVAGFNIGVNAGVAAGQTVFHCHVHLIPRRPGDGGPPGGVRHVIPSNGDYTAR